MKALVLACAGAVFLSGCASVSVTDAHTTRTSSQKPAVIYVQNFETSGGDWRITSRSKSDEQFKRDLSDSLAEALVAEINTYIGPAKRVGRGRVPANAWVLTGRFVRVSEGSPGLRIVVGLGAGGTKMEATSTVLDSAGRPVLAFNTVGGSNAMPGMILSSGPVGAVSSAIQQANRGVRDDTKRTARMITAKLGDYMADRGWIRPVALKVKEPGQFQLVQPIGSAKPLAASSE